MSIVSIILGVSTKGGFSCEMVCAWPHKNLWWSVHGNASLLVHGQVNHGLKYMQNTGLGCSLYMTEIQINNLLIFFFFSSTRVSWNRRFKSSFLLVLFQWESLSGACSLSCNPFPWAALLAYVCMVIIEGLKVIMNIVEHSGEKNIK